MNKREAIAALRELADKLEAMPIDGEDLRCYVDVRFHGVDAKQFAWLKPLVPSSDTVDVDASTHCLSTDWEAARNDISFQIFGPKEVICP